MNRRRMVVAGTVAVVVIGGAVTAYALTSAGSSAADRYRTTTATRSDLTATVSLSGSLTHVDAVTASFPAAGTVTSVSVHAGQQVKAGDLLATMDTTPLRAALLEAQSQVAAAQLAIEQDRNAINAAASASAAATTGAQATTQASAASQASAAAVTQARTGATGGTAGTGSTGKSTASQAEIDKALAAVTQAQKTVDGSCQGLLSGLGQGTGAPSGQKAATTVADLPGSPPASVSASATPSATPTPTPTAAPTTTPLAACMDALQNLSATQHRAATVLDSAAAALAQQATPSGTPTTGARTTTSGTTGRTGSGTAAQSGQTSGTSSPQAKLLADQGTLAVAQQQQTQAQNNLDGASLTAPISGVVGAVDISAGNRATPTKGIVVIGPGAAQVDATASLTDLQQVAVGDQVQVRTVGSSTTLDGTLTAVGALPSSGAGTEAPSYPVVVTVPSGAGGLPEGAPSTASIVTTSLKSALVIPASALTTTSTGATQVTTLGDNGTRTVDVSVGARGQGRVQILSGISGSDVVVLADRTAPLPATNLTNARNAFRPGGANSAPAATSVASPR